VGANNNKIVGDKELLLQKMLNNELLNFMKIDLKKKNFGVSRR